MDRSRRAFAAAVVSVLAWPEAGIKAERRDGPAAPRNFIFFGRDRQRISERAFLENPHIVGAQLEYTWRELEPERDWYELQALLGDLAFLEARGKRLFVQVQDVSFSEEAVVPD